VIDWLAGWLGCLIWKISTESLCWNCRMPRASWPLVTGDNTRWWWRWWSIAGQTYAADKRQQSQKVLIGDWKGEWKSLVLVFIRAVELMC